MDVDIKFTQLMTGLNCFYQHWFPHDPKALVVVVHGLGDHLGRYDTMISNFSNLGYACAIYDQRGHGRTSGRRGYAKNIEELVLDLEAFIGFTRSFLSPQLPLYLVASGVGTIVAIECIIRHAIAVDAFIGISPAIHPISHMPKWKKKLIRKSSKIISSMTVATGISNDMLTKDSDELELLNKDSLFHQRISVGLFAEIEKWCHLAMATCHRINIPTLMLVGSRDKVIDYRFTPQYVERISTADKQCITYEGMYHDLLHDIGKRHVMEDMFAWVSAHY